ncbi:hypothetical protein SLS58_002855 [Diplodia intermedia]|uniref:Heterokaryon incompatibility domain-containing protein n=1 Tax=Diplodia intermedia TaxID=856260 RepID=A0ABR3TXT9_9PEZI
MALAETDVEHEPWQVRVDGLPEAIPSNTGDPSLSRLMSTWLDRCLKDHKGKCGASPDVDANWHPKRLLHISDSSSDRVRLIDTAFEKPTGRYATLSHCWGPNPTFLRLDAENMPSLIAHGIPTAALPPSFRDTVVTCRRLHIAYLWIDSLCILQRGAGSRADWSLHAIQMAQIYTNCVLNIAIDRASSPWAGAFAARDPAPLQHSTVVVPRRTGGSTRVCTVGTTADDPEKLRARQPLAARAWVLQERLLAPRVLHFGGDRVFWECGAAWRDELRPGPPRAGCSSASPSPSPSSSRPLAVYDPFDVPGADARGKPATRFWNVILPVAYFISLYSFELSAILHDINTASLSGHNLRLSQQSRSAAVIKHPRFQHWLKTKTSAALHVDGSERGSSAAISSMSYVCNLLWQALEGLEETDVFLPLIFFCGLHTTDDDPLSGAVGIIKSLTAPLLLRYGANLDLAFVTNELLQGMETDSLDVFCYLFRGLLCSLSHGTVFCIVDGISWVENDEHVNGLRQLLAFMKGLVKEVRRAGSGLLVKILLTSPSMSACSGEWLS